jgi:predicted DNA-binding protein
MPNQTARPFPLNLEVEFLDRLSEPVREGRAKSVSEIIRTALERFDFTNVVVMHPNQLQISVRLPVEVRRNLKKVSRSKHTSVGQLVRAAVEAYLPQLEAAAPVANEPEVRKKPAVKRKRQAKRTRPKRQPAKR